jgi:hypothetical protein
MERCSLRAAATILGMLALFLMQSIHVSADEPKIVGWRIAEGASEGTYIPGAEADGDDQLSVHLSTASEDLVNLPFELKVSASANCLPGGEMASHEITPGYYKVNIRECNLNLCGGLRECNLNQVAMYTQARFSPNGSLHVINKGRTVYFRIWEGATTVYGYIADDVCSDNTGTATLIIQQIKRFPPICSGIDCN